MSPNDDCDRNLGEMEQGSGGLGHQASLYIDRNDLAGLRQFAGRHSDAIDSEYELAWNTGWAFVRLGAPLEGIPMLERAVRLRPDNPMGHWALGTAVMEAGPAADDFARRAEMHFREAIRVRDGWAPRHSLAVLLSMQGRGDEGESLLREGVRLRPNSRRRLEEFADYLDDRGKSSEAEHFRQKASLLET